MHIIKGYLKTIVFEKDSFRICKFALEENVKKFIYIKGQLIHLQMEQLYELHGEFTFHSRYGKQFEVSHYNALVFTEDNQGIIKYLSSSLFSGVGKKTAEKIVEHLKENIIEKILSNSQVLSEIGIKAKQIAIIVSQLKKQKSEHQLITLFSQANLSLEWIAKLQLIYPENLWEVITTDPYAIISTTSGWSFLVAEKLKKILKIPDNSCSRLVAALHYLIKENCNSTGNSYVPKNIVLKELQKYCILNFDLVNQIVNQAVQEKKVMVEHNNFYDFNIYESEINIAKKLLKLQNYQEKINEEKFQNQINQISVTNNLNYDDQQKLALRKFYEYDLTIINGGPGTGKTTLIKALIQLYKLNYPNNNIVICAPTGRATKRLKEQTQEEATTIHKFLKWDLYNNKFQYNTANPLNADLIIIDEMSMVDTILFNHLLIANPNVHKLVLVGDPHQLPSINSGNVLSDLIKNDILNIITLKTIYRQKETSEIINLAYEVKSQNINYQFCNDNEVSFIEIDNSELLLQKITRLFIKLVKKSNIFDVQILASMYKGACGIDAINEAIQKEYNFFSKDKAEFKTNTTLFRVGDKVMQNKNDSEKDIYNGDMGIIKEIIPSKVDKQKIIIRVQYDNRIITYEQNELHNLTLGYAISVHKSQGSEYPFVILVIDRSNTFMLRNNLIYTAITRCQKKLYLVGQKKLFYTAIQRNDNFRLTTLNLRLQTIDIFTI